MSEARTEAAPHPVDAIVVVDAGAARGYGVRRSGVLVGMATTARLPLFLLALAMLACGGASSTGEVDAETVEGWLADDERPLLLDVRSPEEYATGHVPGALNIPHDELAGRLDEVEAARGSGVVVYCERGGRAAHAEALLRDSGFSSVHHLSGDMAAWRAAGRLQERD